MMTKKMTKILFLFPLFLIGCHDFSFGLYGNTPQNSTMITSKPQQDEATMLPSAYGLVQTCTLDKQCTPGSLCFKPDPVNQYIGLCAEVK